MPHNTSNNIVRINTYLTNQVSFNTSLMSHMVIIGLLGILHSVFVKCNVMKVCQLEKKSTEVKLASKREDVENYETNSFGGKYKSMILTQIHTVPDDALVFDGYGKQIQVKKTLISGRCRRLWEMRTSL